MIQKHAIPILEFDDNPEAVIPQFLSFLLDTRSAFDTIVQN